MTSLTAFGMSGLISWGERGVLVMCWWIISSGSVERKGGYPTNNYVNLILGDRVLRKIRHQGNKSLLYSLRLGLPVLCLLGGCKRGIVLCLGNP